MSRPTMPRARLRVPLLLAALAGCQDPTDPPPGMQPRSSQGTLATWTVNSLADPGDGTCDDTECTLREAIDAAGSGDHIGFGGLQGEIKLTDGALRIHYKMLTIDGAGRITIDAQQNSGVLHVYGILGPSTSASLVGLTFSNGSTSLSGGGIYVAGATLTLDAVTLSNNASGGQGGGLNVEGESAFPSQVTIRNSFIVDNDAAEGGGGIFVGEGSSLTLTSSSIAGNGAGDELDDSGGGVYVDQGASVTLINSTVDSNRTVGNSGGVFNWGTLSVAGTTISGNTYGIANPGAATVEQSTISGNSNGGIASSGTLVLRNSTVTRNGSNGGLFVGGPDATITVANSIIAGNLAFSDCGGTSGGAYVSLGYNVTSGCGFSAAGDVDVARAQVFTEVLEPELEDHGGPTRTHALIARSRAADAGYCPGETTDQRGFARPVDDPVMPNTLDACDIGAYELQGPVTAVADLMISQAATKTSVKQGELLTYSIRVQNLGPETAPNVVVTDLLPTGATFVEARHDKGSHTAPPRGETGTLTWSVGDMLDQANEVAEITVTVRVRGKTSITNTTSVTGDVADPNEANNSAALRVSVVSGTSGKGGGSKR